jgi:hypothetical protein
MARYWCVVYEVATLASFSNISSRAGMGVRSHKRTRNVTDEFSEVYRRVETFSLRVGLLDANSSSRIVLIDDSSLVVDDRSKKT